MQEYHNAFESKKKLLTFSCFKYEADIYLKKNHVIKTKKISNHQTLLI